MSFVINGGRLVVSGICAAYLTKVIASSTYLDLGQKILVMAYFCCVCLLGTFLYQKIASDYEDKEKRMLFFVAATIAAVLIIMKPDIWVNRYFEPALTIVSTGQKNENSAGNEVWIMGIVSDGKEIDLSSIPVNEEWVINGGNILCNEEKESSLTIPLSKAKNIKVEFLKHAWSGKVKIEDGDVSSEVDLYSVESDVYVYSVNSNQPTEDWSVKDALWLMSAWVCVSAVLCIAFALINRKKYVKQMK